jgi:hypothetical protein
MAVASAGDGVRATLAALSRQLRAAFPDLPAHAAAASVSEAWRAARLIGVDTVETVERLAREHLTAMRRCGDVVRCSVRAANASQPSAPEARGLGSGRGAAHNSDEPSR